MGEGLVFWVVALVRVRRALPVAVLEIIIVVMLDDLMGWNSSSCREMSVYPLQCEKGTNVMTSLFVS